MNLFAVIALSCNMLTDTSILVLTRMLLMALTITGMMLLEARSNLLAPVAVLFWKLVLAIFIGIIELACCRALTVSIPPLAPSGFVPVLNHGSRARFAGT